MNTEKKKNVIDLVQKAGNPDEYETLWDEEGIPYESKKKSEIKKGKKSRSKGAAFELKVRKDLESKGRIVDKWTNNVDVEKGEIFGAKRKFNPYSRIMSIGTGFPDFISFKKISKNNYNIVGVEVKLNGILSKEEKEKCAWYLQNEIFSEIWVASSIKKGNRVEIRYENFKERYGDKYNKT